MVALNINGKNVEVDSAPETPLLWVLRGPLGLTGTKFDCGIGQCGACTVHMDGEAVRSCQLPVGAGGGAKITTIEAIRGTDAGRRVRRAWLDLEVVQCGYCQPGQIMSATALLAAVPQPDDIDIDDAMAGKIYRCGTYLRAREAIKKAAGIA